MEILPEIAFYIIASIVCFGISGLCEAIMDKLQFHFESSVFYYFKKKYFWDPKISWYNKYKNKDPLAGPRFPGSTTLFVGVTDAWHFFKLLRNLFIVIGVFILLYAIVGFLLALIYVVVARVVFGLVFTLFYNILGD
jgi:hypothetical protein